MEVDEDHSQNRSKTAAEAANLRQHAARQRERAVEVSWERKPSWALRNRGLPSRPMGVGITPVQYQLARIPASMGCFYYCIVVRAAFCFGGTPGQTARMRKSP